MHVSVLINSLAGSAQPSLIQDRVREALFRCDLNSIIPKNLSETRDFIESEILSGTDALLVCGGDGTLNTILQHAMRLKQSGKKTPPICLISSGTANDLATELGISRRVEKAARLIFEGKITAIDVLRVTSEKSESYMITNGGVGIPALTAARFNDIRKGIRGSSHEWLKSIGMFGIKTASSRIYELLFLETLLTWKTQNWEIEIQINDGKAFRTQAPFILVNNQARLGKHFVPAPYTLNNDGTFDLTIINQTNFFKVLKTTRLIQKGHEATTDCKHWEVRKLAIRSVNPNTNISFFGDGEILQTDVQEVCVEVLPASIEVYAGSLQ